MRKVSSKDFQKNTGEWKTAALREPIAITRHDRTELVLLAYDEFMKLKEKPKVVRLSDLEAEDFRRITSSKMNKKHDHLNEEMEE